MSTILSIILSNLVLATALALLAALVTRIWRSPQLAHALWALVLLKLIAPPLAPVPFETTWPVFHAEESANSASTPANSQRNDPKLDASLLADSEWASLNPDTIGPGSAYSSQNRGTTSVDSLARQGVMPTRWYRRPPPELTAPAWLRIFGTIWCVGSIAFALMVAIRILRFRTVLAASTPAAPEIQATAIHISRRLGLRHCPSVRIVDARIPPLVWNLGFKPLILLPAELLDQLDCGQRECVIAHELVHVRRRDHLVRWLEMVTLTAFWWNPIAWLARRKLHEAEEECCDAWVVWTMPEQRRSYGRALLKTIEFLTECPGRPVLAGSAFGSPFFKRRIEMIVKAKMKRSMSWPALAVVAFLGVGVLPVVAQTVTSPNVPAPAEPSSTPGSSDPTAFPQDIAARLNGAPITIDQLAKEALRKHGAAELETLVNRLIVERACRDQGILITSSEIEARIEQTASNFGLSSSEFLERLEKARNLSAESYRQEVIQPTLALEKLAGSQDPQRIRDLFERLTKNAKIERNPRFAKQELDPLNEANPGTGTLSEPRLTQPLRSDIEHSAIEYQEELELLRAKVRYLELLNKSHRRQ